MRPEKIVRLSNHEIKKRKSKKKAKAQSLRDAKRNETDESRKRRHIRRIEEQKRIRNEIQSAQEIRVEEFKAGGGIGD